MRKLFYNESPVDKGLDNMFNQKQATVCVGGKRDTKAVPAPAFDCGLTASNSGRTYNLPLIMTAHNPLKPHLMDEDEIMDERLEQQQRIIHHD